MLLINKTFGISSFSVVQKLRKITGIKKIGHAGTLDPLAEGLLIILIGKNETKLSQNFLKLNKVYKTKIVLGISTDTLDLEGKITEQKECTNIDRAQIENAFLKMRSCKKYRVPIYSAIKIDGKPLYKYAREGAKVKLPEKEMCIYEYKIENIKENAQEKTIEIDAELKVSSGTYVRTINYHIGKQLNCPATTSKIIRTKIGEYDIKNAIDLNSINSNNWQQYNIKLDEKI